ncbi:MAG TPA: hypothetical protein VI078_13120 [bacterium]
MTLRPLRLAPASAVLLLALAGAARAGEADALIDRVLEAHGGKAALAKVRSYRMEGRITSVMQGTGSFVRTFARPDRLRVVLDYPGRPETRILDGARGWRSGGEGHLAPEPVEGFLLGSMIVQAGRANLPWLLDERRAEAKLLPPEHGGALQGIAVPLGPGMKVTAFVDLTSGRIVRSQGDLDVPGMQTGFVTEYWDYRSVDGVLFPFHEGNFASGRNTGATMVSKITVNPPLTDADFRP